MNDPVVCWLNVKQREAGGPLDTTQLEEQVLSSMIGGRRVSSLDPSHFTCPIRALVYSMLRRGVPYVDLAPGLRSKGVDEESLAYVVDLFFVDSLPHEALVEAVADLKRIARLRPFVADVSAWLKRAPYLTWEKAVVELGAIVRESGKRSALDTKG